MTASDSAVVDVSLREMVLAMKHYEDADAFRYFQASYVAPDGSTQPSTTMRVTMAQARRDLGL